MSYNIDNWKTKKLENLTVPLKAFYEGARKDWYPEKPQIIDFDTNEVELECGCEQTITGILKDGMLTITKFDMSGEGSGSFMYEVLEDALKQSTGELDAVLVWESGDTIESFKVNDGIITRKNIDL